MKNHITLRKEGDVFAQKRQYKDSIQRYDAAIKVDNKYYTAYLHLGNALVQLKDYEKAKENYVEAIKIKNNYIHAYRKLGDLYQILGDGKTDQKDKTKDYETGRKCYEKALKYKWDYVIDRIKLADVLSKLGDCSNDTIQYKYYKMAHSEYSYATEISLKYKEYAQEKIDILSKLIEKQENSGISEVSTEANYKIKSILNTPTETTESDEEFEDYKLDLEELAWLETDILKGNSTELKQKQIELLKDNQFKQKDDITKLFSKLLNYTNESGSSVISYIIRASNIDAMKELMNMFKDKNLSKYEMPYQEIKEALNVTELTTDDNIGQFLELFYQQDDVSKLLGEFTHE